MAKRYLGDGVYVDDDGHMLKLTTESFGTPDNIIYLEPQVLDALLGYVGAERRAPAPADDPVPLEEDLDGE